MRSLALALALLAATASGQPRNRHTPIRPAVSGNELETYIAGRDKSLLRILPTSGGAPGGECSGTAITGTRGETVTFTRASAAYCTKSDGTMVSLTNNQPRVSLISGAPMLLVEGASTNLALRSEETDNVAWTNVGIAPTFNGGNVATMTPWAAAVAEDYTFSATTAGQDSVRSQNPGVVCAANSTCSYSIYVYGVGGSGTIDLCRYGSATASCGICAVTSGAWNRCTYTVTLGATGDTFNGLAIGNSTKWNGGTNRSALRVLVSGAQQETGSFATSYIATAGTSATRAADAASVAVPAAFSANPYCAGATARHSNGTTWPSGQYTSIIATSIPTANNGWQLVSDTSSRARGIQCDNAGAACSSYRGFTDTSAALSGTVDLLYNFVSTAFTVKKNGAAIPGGSLSLDGAGVSPTAQLATLYIGTGGGGLTAMGGYIGNVRLGNSSGACDR